MNDIKVWIHGLAAAGISAFASAASGAIALPAVFTFDKPGLLNMVKLATVPALLAVFAYGKRARSRPLPLLPVRTDNGETWGDLGSRLDLEKETAGPSTTPDFL